MLGGPDAVLENSFLADKGRVFGLMFAIIVGIVIIGGIKSIARVSDKVVTFMFGSWVQWRRLRATGSFLRDAPPEVDR